jgi:hypothetical protein
MQYPFFGKVLFLTSAQSNQLTRQKNGTKFLKKLLSFVSKLDNFIQCFVRGHYFALVCLETPRGDKYQDQRPGGAHRQDSEDEGKQNARPVFASA